VVNAPVRRLSIAEADCSYWRMGIIERDCGFPSPSESYARRMCVLVVRNLDNFPDFGCGSDLGFNSKGETHAACSEDRILQEPADSRGSSWKRQRKSEHGNWREGCRDHHRRNCNREQLSSTALELESSGRSLGFQSRPKPTDRMPDTWLSSQAKTPALERRITPPQTASFGPRQG